MMTIKNIFDNGDTVYVITDPFQYKCIIVRIAKNWNGGIEYEVSSAGELRWYQAVELSKEQDMPVNVMISPDDDEDE